MEADSGTTQHKAGLHHGCLLPACTRIHAHQLEDLPAQRTYLEQGHCTISKEPCSPVSRVTLPIPRKKAHRS